VVTLGAHAHFNTFGMTSGAGVSRYQATIAFAGEGSPVETNGVNLLNGRSTPTPRCSWITRCRTASREVFRAVLDDRGHSVFQGKIIVRPHAQKTDAKMMTRALLLSDEAEADNKPELEIFADDVHLRPRRHHRRARREPAVLSAARGIPRRKPRRC
jgi:Fe-S cluster assembly protein SufD